MDRARNFASAASTRDSRVVEVEALFDLGQPYFHCQQMLVVAGQDLRDAGHHLAQLGNPVQRPVELCECALSLSTAR